MASALEPGEAPAHRRIVAEEPVTGELVEVVRELVAVGAEIGTVGVARDLHALVGREVRVDPPLGGVERAFEA